MVLDNCTKVKGAISKNLVYLKQCLTTNIVQEYVKRLHDDLLSQISWITPLGTSQRNFGRHIYSINDFLDEKNTSLWLIKNCQEANYCQISLERMIRLKLLQDYKNWGWSSCQRTSVDTETQKKMMAFFYKKQQEQKEIKADNEDIYLNIQWANPIQLKQQLIGASDQISWKPK